jgi:hypothetical protein
VALRLSLNAKMLKKHLGNIYQNPIDPSVYLHISCPKLSHCLQLSYSNMPQTSVIDSEKAERAAYILKNAPFLTAEEAMLAAKFPAEQASLKSMQRKVRQTLPGGTK